MIVCSWERLSHLLIAEPGQDSVSEDYRLPPVLLPSPGGTAPDCVFLSARSFPLQARDRKSFLPENVFGMPKHGIL